MMALDMYWLSNPDWYESVPNGFGRFVDQVKEDAPQEAKDSYNRYIEQIKRAAELKRRTGEQLI